MSAAQRITPCLWFDDRAEEAARSYTSIFENSKITTVSRYGKEIVPRILADLMSDPDVEKSQRTMAAMLPMKKLDIAALKRAHAG